MKFNGVMEMDPKDDKLDRSLAAYLKDKQAIPNDLQPYRETLARLEALRDVPERDVDVQAVAKETFLQQVKSMPMPVSQMPNRRLKGWKKFFRREHSPMTTILGFVLALVVAFGGAGTTAYAAQDSLPNEPLYPVKEFTEQIRLTLTTDTEAKVHLLLDLTEERVGEMIGLVNQGLDVPEQTQLRLQDHLELAFTEIAQLGDSALKDALQQVQTMAQNQIKAMEQVQENGSEDLPSEALQNTIKAMNQVRQDAEDGIADPLSFRLRQGSNRPENAPDQPDNVPPGKRNDVESPSGEGGAGQGYGDGTGEGGGAYGNGNGDGTEDGGDAYGNGYGDGSGDGGGAYGDGNGDGMCDCTCDHLDCDCAVECTPQGLKSGQKGSGGGNK
jgi:hypothetical protein